MADSKLVSVPIPPMTQDSRGVVHLGITRMPEPPELTDGVTQALALAESPDPEVRQRIQQGPDLSMGAFDEDAPPSVAAQGLLDRPEVQEEGVLQNAYRESHDTLAQDGTHAQLNTFAREMAPVATRTGDTRETERQWFLNGIEPTPKPSGATLRPDPPALSREDVRRALTAMPTRTLHDTIPASHVSIVDDWLRQQGKTDEPPPSGFAARLQAQLRKAGEVYAGGAWTLGQIIFENLWKLEVPKHLVYDAVAHLNEASRLLTGVDMNHFLPTLNRAVLHDPTTGEFARDAEGQLEMTAHTSMNPAIMEASDFVGFYDPATDKAYDLSFFTRTGMLATEAALLFGAMRLGGAASANLTPIFVNTRAFQGLTATFDALRLSRVRKFASAAAAGTGSGVAFDLIYLTPDNLRPAVELLADDWNLLGQGEIEDVLWDYTHHSQGSHTLEARLIAAGAFATLGFGIGATVGAGIVTIPWALGASVKWSAKLKAMLKAQPIDGVDPEQAADHLVGQLNQVQQGPHGSFVNQVIDPNLHWRRFRDPAAVDSPEEISLQAGRQLPSTAAFEQLIREHPEGFTVDLKTFKPMIKGYVVAPVKPAEIIIEGRELKRSDVRKYNEMLDDMLESSDDLEVYAGGWFSDEKQAYFLDAVHIFDDEATAVYTAQAGKQISFFNLSTFETVTTQDAITKLQETGTYQTDAADVVRRKVEALTRRFESARDQRRRRRGEQEAAVDSPPAALPSQSGPLLKPAEPVEQDELGYISHALESMKATPLTKGTGQQFYNRLKKAGVKYDELEWSGFMDVLREQGFEKKQWTKPELVEYLRANRIVLKEVELSDEAAARAIEGAQKISQPKLTASEHDRLRALREDYHGGLGVLIPHKAREAFERGRPVRDDQQHPQIRELLDLQARESAHRDFVVKASKAVAPRFKDYTLPGGTNYKEFVISLPQDQPAFREVGWPSGEFDPDLAPIGNRRVGHFGEVSPNVVAHVRTTDRVVLGDKDRRELLKDAQDMGLSGSDFSQMNLEGYGKKVFFLEEVQSDWAAQFRMAKPLSKEREHTAPFITRLGPNPEATQDWTALALKRMMRYAADHDYDYVAWTPGKVQQDRYDLGAVVDAIEYRGMDRGETSVILRGIKGVSDEDLMVELDGDGVIFLTDIGAPDQWKGKHISEVVGKEIGEKILHGRAKIEYPYDQVGTISGLDLRVGGEGLAKYYDEVLPQVAKKVLKKLDKHATLETIPLYDEVAVAIPLTPTLKASAKRGQQLFAPLAAATTGALATQAGAPEGAD